MEPTAAAGDLEGRSPRAGWTLLGTIGAGGRARVDRRGVIAIEGGSWSMDWWVGAEDRWHIASDGALVRQSLVDATPVILSALRVPGGELEHRAWAVVDGASGMPVLVVDLHNASSVPVALALAFTDSSGTSVVDVSDGIVRIGETAVARFSRQPSRFAFASAERSAREVAIAGDASVSLPEGGVRANDGTNTLGLIFPLPHTATLRVVIPLDARLTAADLNRVDPASLPPHDRVVSGWQAQVARAPRFDLPERELDAALDAARCHLLVHAAADDPLRSPGVVVDGVERNELAVALDEQGFAAEAERLLLRALDAQRPDGSFDPDRLDATASWLVATERHVALTGTGELAAVLAEQVVSASHWLSTRQRIRVRRSRSFFASGAGPIGLSGDERVAYDARWTMRAYSAAISMLDLAGQSDAALAVRLHRSALVDEMGRRRIDTAGPGDGARVSDPIASMRRDLLLGEPLWAWSSDRDPHDPARTVAFLRNVRAAVVDDSGAAVDILPGFGEQWLGQPVAVHRLATTAGSLSFAVRWHGARPALLWEVEGDRAFVLTCSTIDPEWSSGEARGEVLLAAPVIDHDHIEIAPRSEPHAELDPPAPGGSFS